MLQDEVKRAVEVLRGGGLILYPTDTVWGIGCDATNEEAVRRVFALKQRAEGKALICLVDSPFRLSKYVRAIHEVTWDLIELATRPLTIIHDGAMGLAPSVLGADGSVALRVTQEEFSKALCYRFGKPVVSTSANVSGDRTPRCFDEISEQVKEGVDYVFNNNRRQRGGEPSTLIRMKPDGAFTILRK